MEQLSSQHASPRGTKRFYQPELDGLRFCAFLAVFVYHATRSDPARHFYTSLSYGMQVFFLLSSYLITQLLIKEKQSTGSIHIKAFYIRRILRIWPLYFFFLFTCAIIGIFSPGFHSSVGRVAAFALMVGNWYVGAFGFGRSPIYPLWSISLEEQFYVVWPAIVLVSGRFLVYAAAGIIPLSIACILFLSHNGADSTKIATNSGTECMYFAAGTLTALLLASKPITKNWMRGICLIGCGLLSWPAIEILMSMRNGANAPVGWSQAVGFSAIAVSGVMILCGFLSLPSALFPRWLTYLGKISYGLYVYHKLFQKEITHVTGHFHRPLLDDVASLVLTIACAALSYRFLETPFLRLKERFAFVRSRPA